jgi:hypothetical protein
LPNTNSKGEKDQSLKWCFATVAFGVAAGIRAAAEIGLGVQKHALRGRLLTRRLFVDIEIMEVEVKVNSGRAKNRAYCSAGAGLFRIKQR